MKKAVQFLLLFGFCAGLLVLGEALIGHTEDRTSTLVLAPEIEQEKLIPVSLVVGEIRYDLEVVLGSTVYNLLETAKEQGLEFKGREFSGMGFFVEELNGKAQNTKGQMYWVYSINSKKAEVGVSSYIIQPNDVISWSYEKSY